MQVTQASPSSLDWEVYFTHGGGEVKFVSVSQFPYVESWGINWQLPAGAQRTGKPLVCGEYGPRPPVGV